MLSFRARPLHIVLVALVGLGATSPAIAGTGPAITAVAQMRAIQEQLVQDKSRSDWHAFLSDAEQLRNFLHGAPAAELEVARAQLNLGMRSAAMQTVERVVAMGATHPILESPLFRPVKAALAGAARRGGLPISNAASALSIVDAGLLPEDIDYDAIRRTFFVTSVQRHSIVSLDSRGGTHAFAESPNNWPMVALKIDSKRRRLWATEVAFDGFAVVPRKDWGRSALLEYDLDAGTLLRRVEGPPLGAFGDVFLLPNGDPVVSDGERGGVYRVVADRLIRLDHGEFVSPQTATSCGDEGMLFIPDYVRGLATMNLKTGAVRWLESQGRFALDETDGLYCDGRTLLAVQNGPTHPRVVSYRRDGRRITGMRILDRGPDADFTHGVVVGRRFIFLAATGWRGLDDKGQTKIDVPPVQPLLKGAKISNLS